MDTRFFVEVKKDVGGDGMSMTRGASNVGAASGLSWPNRLDFAKSLQSPDFAFRDDQLKNCAILKNDQGQPRPWAGAFADVYQATLPGGKQLAIRVFAGAVPNVRIATRK